ncbi:hypothetical protein VZT92_000145 [Zoarces viviparus]|uniref:Interleukin 17C n=1 Tax=Zoarces viviparus TaxID=48416 RepID=A0AAW1G4M7_ZOAVI
MTRLVILQMISLLIFNDQISSPAAAGRSSRCVGVDQVKNTADRFQRRHWGRLSFLQSTQDTRTCAQTVAEMRGDLSNRSLSPWKYSLNKEDNRIPYKISFAECLCDGCIINQREDMRYNSVPVFASLMVMRKTPCPRDPNKFVVSKDVIKVPVGCTCAVPKYTTLSKKLPS